MEAARVGEGNQILIEVTKLQTQMEQVAKSIEEIGKLGNTLAEVVQSVKSAHNRIDDVKTAVEKELTKQKEDFEKKIAAETKLREECIAAEAKIRKEEIAAEVKAREKADDAEAKARGKTEDSLTWVWRTIGTSLIGGVIALLLFN